MELEAGRGDVTESEVWLEVSKDGGNTFGARRIRSAGAVGERRTAVTWRRNGKARGKDWVISFNSTDADGGTWTEAYADLEVEGYYLVVTETAAKYHANVGYDSLITVNTAIADIKHVSVRFDYNIVSEEGKLLVSGHSSHACINSNQKLIRIPSYVKSLMEERCIKRG